MTAVPYEVTVTAAVIFAYAHTPETAETMIRQHLTSLGYIVLDVHAVHASEVTDA